MRDLLLHSGTLAFDEVCIAFSVLDRYKIVCLISMIILIETQDATESQKCKEMYVNFVKHSVTATNI